MPSPLGQNRPYTADRRTRLAITLAIFGVGLFMISSPAWLLEGPDNEVIRNAVVGLAGALIGYAVTGLVSETLNPTYDAVLEAFDLNSETSYDRSFRNLIHSEVTAAVAEVTSSSVDFGPRAKLFSRLELHNSEEALRIQSISLSQKWQTTQILEELFKGRPQLKARILLIHPYSSHVRHREDDIGFRPGTIRQLVEETILPLASLKNRDHIGDRLEVRGYFATPYYGIISCDSSRCLITLSREGRGGDQNHGILIEGSTQSSAAMISDLEQGFDDRWMNSFDLLSPLIVSLELEEPSLSDDGVSVRLLSESDLDEPSVQIAVENGQILRRSAVGARELQILVQADESASQTVRVQVEQALSKDHHQWLRNPVEILVRGSKN